MIKFRGYLEYQGKICGKKYVKYISSCYRTVPSAIWEIFSEFLNICQYCTRPRAITTLSLNACLNQMNQELSYLLIASSLHNMI